MLASFTLLCAAQVTLTLLPEAHVRGTEIRLTDVATLAGDAGALAALAAETLGYAPAPGYSRLLQGWRLEQNLERAHPELDIVLAGAPTARVWPATAVVPARAIEAAAATALRGALAGADATAELVDELADVIVPAGSSAPSVTARWNAAELGPGNVSVPVQIDVDGEPYRTLWTEWRIALFEVRPVLVSDQAAGTKLELAMIENRRVPVAARSKRTALPSGLAAGAVLARDLAAGSPVTEADVVRPKIVAPGDQIYLEIRKGSVVAKVPVLVRDAGALGERIRVTTESQRELMAVLVARDMAQIDLTQDR